jgi:ribose/xylose/arabinose/galactoside ABC-type transport system permease subunit
MFGLVLLFNLIFTPSFFSLKLQDGHLYGSLVDVFNRGTPVALLSLGMTLVIATGGVDLSVGAVMAIAGTVAACLIMRPASSILHNVNVGGSMALIVLLALAAALVCGLFNGFMVSYVGLQPIVATLLLMVAGRGVAQLMANGQIVTFEKPEFARIATGATLGIFNPIWIFAISATAVATLARKTAFGLFVESTGSNATAARYSGLDSRLIKLSVYAISGLCAGIAGIIATADIKGADASTSGLYFELDAILAVAVGGASLAGGRFSLTGSIIGAFLMQALTTTLYTRGVSTELTLVLKATVVVLVCLLHSPEFRAKLSRRRTA